MARGGAVVTSACYMELKNTPMEHVRAKDLCVIPYALGVQTTYHRPVTPPWAIDGDYDKYYLVTYDYQKIIPKNVRNCTLSLMLMLMLVL